MLNSAKGNCTSDVNTTMEILKGNQNENLHIALQEKLENPSLRQKSNRNK